MNTGGAVNLLTALAAVLAALAGCGWIGTTLYKTFFGGPERAANAAVAFTGAAKVLVDELQEEVDKARAQTEKVQAKAEAVIDALQVKFDRALADAERAQSEATDLRRTIAQERQLSEAKIARLESENRELQQLNGQLRTQLGEGPR